MARTVSAAVVLHWWYVSANTTTERGSQSHASTLVKGRKIEFSGSLESSIVE
jgi:hypothetical protein